MSILIMGFRKLPLRLGINPPPCCNQMPKMHGQSRFAYPKFEVGELAWTPQFFWKKPQILYFSYSLRWTKYPFHLLCFLYSFTKVCFWQIGLGFDKGIWGEKNIMEDNLWWKYSRLLHYVVQHIVNVINSSRSPLEWGWEGGYVWR